MPSLLFCVAQTLLSVLVRLGMAEKAALKLSAAAPCPSTDKSVCATQTYRSTSKSDATDGSASLKMMAVSAIGNRTT
ncbi:MAG: hypothetical protein QOE68_3669 [Thermoanaerobaculia bacterium]|nr:hypothetical protein [Thermoanaerobaculia bacterium]